MNRRFMAIVAVALAAGCGMMIYFVHAPGSATVGAPFEITISSTTDSAGTATPKACIRIPTGWTVADAQIAVRRFGEEAGEPVAVVANAGDGTNMDGSYPQSGQSWHCFDGPDAEYNTDQIGDWTFTVTADSTGSFLLAYAVGNTGGYFGTSLPSNTVIYRMLSVGAPAHFFDDWKTTVPVDEELQILPAGDAIWALRRSDGQTFVSQDGLAWEPTNFPPLPLNESPSLHGLGYNGTDTVLFVNRAQKVDVYRLSKDGWQRMLSLSFDNGFLPWNALAYDGNRWVAAGSDGSVVTIDKKFRRAHAYNPGAGSLQSIAVLDGVVVLGGTSGVAYSSGDEWLVSTPPLGGGTYHVSAHDGEFWVLNGSGSAAKAFPSDVNDWTTFSVPYGTYQSAYWQNTHVLIGGSLLYTSEDGVTFQQRYTGSGRSYYMAPSGTDNVLVLERMVAIHPHFEPVRDQGFTAAVGNEIVKTLAFDVNGTGDVMFGAASPVTTPFSVRSYSCDAITAPAFHKRCLATIAFTPTAEGRFIEYFSADITWPVAASAKVMLVGSTQPWAGANQAPSAPILVRPANGASALGASVEFVWQKASDPEGTPVTYDLFVCQQESFEGCSPVPVQSAAASLPGGVFGWMAGLAMFGAVVLRRKETVLALVLLGAFACSEDSAALKKVPAPNEVAYTVDGLQAGTKYFWKVVAHDTFGGAAESEVRTFTTK